MICDINTRTEHFKIEGAITSGCCHHGGLIKLGMLTEGFLLGDISSSGDLGGCEGQSECSVWL